MGARVELDAALISLPAARRALEEDRVSSSVLTEHALKSARSSDLNAFIELDTEGARRQAEAVDARRHRGLPLGPLAGIPLAIKDNIVMPGLPTTCGSRSLAQWHAPYEATVCRRLRQAGAVLLGKTNLDEFAMGSSGESSAFGPTKNPWDRRRSPGGSSSGSAAAVAGGLCPAALGSDTGGSIRQPAAFCGLTGLRPTYGRISRFGLVAFASSLDQIGPLARNAEDLRTLFDIIAGPDPHDATSHRPRKPKRSRVRPTTSSPLRGLRVGQLGREFEQLLSSEVGDAVEGALIHLQHLGAELVEIELPHARFALSSYYLICMAEASSNLARYDGVRFGHRADTADDWAELYARSRSEGFGDEVKRRILLGTFALSAGYHHALYDKATAARELIRADYARAFEQVDLLAGPTTPHAAFALGERQGEPLAMYLEDRFTVASSLAGLPALSLPCGLSAAGLPLGLQLVAERDGDEALLDIAATIQRESDWQANDTPAEQR